MVARESATLTRSRTRYAREETPRRSPRPSRTRRARSSSTRFSPDSSRGRQRDASQRRRARTWTSALGLCRRLLKAEEGGVEGDDAERLVSRTLAGAERRDARRRRRRRGDESSRRRRRRDALRHPRGTDGASGRVERRAWGAIGADVRGRRPAGAIGARGRRPAGAIGAPRSPPRPSPPLRFRFRSVATRAPTASAQVGGYFFAGARRRARAPPPTIRPTERSAARPAERWPCLISSSSSRAPRSGGTRAEDERRRLDASIARRRRVSLGRPPRRVAAARPSRAAVASSTAAAARFPLGRSSDDAAISARCRSRATVPGIRAFRRRRRRRVAGVDGDRGASRPCPDRGRRRGRDARRGGRASAARVVDALVAAYAGGTQAAVALSREPEAAGYGPDIATLDDVLRAMLGGDD